MLNCWRACALRELESILLLVWPTEDVKKNATRFRGFAAHGQNRFRHPPSPTPAMSSFSTAHRLYVKSLYKRMLKNETDWVIRYDLMRGRRLAIRAEFERNRYASAMAAPRRVRSMLFSIVTSRTLVRSRPS
jgi:hypothetical protein